MKPRKTSIKRETKETSVSVVINLDGTGKTTINTGIKFLDHLIGSFGKHSMMDLTVKAKSKDGLCGWFKYGTRKIGRFKKKSYEFFKRDGKYKIYRSRDY